MIAEEAIVCPFCGCQVGDVSVPETSTLGILSIIFGAMGGFVGLVLGVIGLINYKIDSNRRNCKIGIGLFCVWFVISIIICGIFIATTLRIFYGNSGNIFWVMSKYVEI